jgi:GNAT superfamily N-acetyltransferase
MAIVELRSASIDDYDFAYRVHRAAMRPSIEQTYGWDEDFHARYFRLHFSPAHWEIIRYRGTDVGVFSVEERGESLFLALIAILPEYQGRGIGTTLICKLQQKASMRGMTVTLQVLKVNRARELYERLGFELTGQTTTHYRMEWSDEGAGA